MVTNVINKNLKITAQAIYDELVSRGINVHVVMLPKATVMLFNYKGGHVIVGANPDVSAATAVTIAQNKALTYELATHYHTTPVPATHIDDTIENAKTFLNRYGRIVVKPIDGAHGNGVSTHITTEQQLLKAIETARAHSDSKRVLLQEYISGDDIRVLILDGKFVGAVRREPARVIGGGTHTVDQLIEIENTHPDRGTKAYTKKMNVIDVGAARRYLSRQERRRIPKKGEHVQVVGTANMGTGGRAIECSRTIPKEMIEQAIRMSELAGTFICGVDFLYNQEASTWRLIEINASPSFGMHMMPSEGSPIDNLPVQYVDALLAKYSKV